MSIPILTEICQQKSKWLLSKSALPHNQNDEQFVLDLKLAFVNTDDEYCMWYRKKPLYYEKKDDLGGICLSDQIQLSPRIVVHTYSYYFGEKPALSEICKHFFLWKCSKYVLSRKICCCSNLFNFIKKWSENENSNKDYMSTRQKFFTKFLYKKTLAFIVRGSHYARPCCSLF